MGPCSDKESWFMGSIVHTLAVRFERSSSGTDFCQIVMLV
jgi:hypothetical protein